MTGEIFFEIDIAELKRKLDGGEASARV